MAWRLAKSLIKLREEINIAYPKRNKASDGTIGDEAHQKQGKSSDHNPWVNGAVVTALDITHDPKNGVDIGTLADELVASRDPRIKYVIANGLIAGPYTDWAWQKNTGHSDHMHISVNTNNYDDDRSWNIKEEDMAEKVSLETARILYAMIGYDGIRNKLNALKGDMDSELHRVQVGKQELTSAYIRNLYNSPAFKDAAKTMAGINAEAMARRAEANTRPTTEAEKKLQQIKEIVKE